MQKNASPSSWSARTGGTRRCSCRGACRPSAGCRRRSSQTVLSLASRPKGLEEPPARRDMGAGGRQKVLAVDVAHPVFLAVWREASATAGGWAPGMAVAQPWTPSSWRALHALQQPDWPDPPAVEAVRERLGQLPPLVFAGEARALRRALGEAGEGRAFLLQAGDCAESFRQVSAVAIRERWCSCRCPRCSPTGRRCRSSRWGGSRGSSRSRARRSRSVGGVDLPSFRGHAIHSDAPTRGAGAGSRANGAGLLPGRFDAQPARVHEGRLRRPHAGAHLEPGVRLELARGATLRGDRERDRARAAVHAGDRDRPRRRGARSTRSTCGRVRGAPARRGPLVAATRRRATGTPARRTSSGWASGRASRTARRVPRRCRELGAKIGPDATPTRWSRSERLNPEHPGAPRRLPAGRGPRARGCPRSCAPCARAVAVLWACDPMHANTFVALGHKTRRFDDVLAEIEGFFAAHREVGSWPGGVTSRSRART